VFPPYKESSDIVSLEEYKKNLGVIPPLSLAYVAAVLEEYGCKVKIIDASALNLDVSKTSSMVSAFKPDFLGYTLSTFQFQHTLGWIKVIKENYPSPVIVGGIHMNVFPQETLTHKEIDFGVIGEAEYTLPDLLYSFKKNRPLEEVNGICFRRKEKIVFTPKREPIKDLDRVPFPSRHLLPNDKYYSLISRKKNFTAMITSIGCPFSCIFCDNHTISYRARSAENVVNEIQECKEKYDINEIDIFDGTFTVNRGRVLEICKDIIDRDLKIDWSFRTRADLVDKEMLKLLSEAGCKRIYYGIESGDSGILKTLNKEVDIDHIKKILYLTKMEKIDNFGYFMIGSPGETKETIKNTVKLMNTLPLDFVQISPVFSPPNTKIYELVKEKIGYDHWAKYTLTGETAILPRPQVSFSDKQIRQYVRSAYLKFYLRPKYILKHFGGLKSINEFIRSINALFDMIIAYIRNI